jgi:carboxylesterase
MAPLAAAIEGRYPMWVARVAGHATDVGDLAETSWLDWYASAEAGLHALRAAAPRTVVVGLSMGALLAMRLAIEHREEVAGLGLLSPAVALQRGMVRRASRFLHALAALDARSSALRRQLARVRFSKDGSDISDAAVRATHPGYRQVPLRALLNLLLLQRVALRDAPQITQPALVVHATHDHTCPVAAARALYAQLGSRDKRLVVLAESFHVVTVDRERAHVAAEVVRLLDAVAAGQPVTA